MNDAGPRRRHRLQLQLVGGFLVTMVLLSVVVLVVEGRLATAQFEDQAGRAAALQGRVLDTRLAEESRSVTELMETVLQGQFGIRGRGILTADPQQRDPRARLALAGLQRATRSGYASVFDVTSGETVLAVVLTDRIIEPDPQVAAELAAEPSVVRRVVPLASGRFATAHVLTIERASPTPLLVVLAAPLDDHRARTLALDVGVDGIELVVDGRVVAGSGVAVGAAPLGDITRPGEVQRLADGRLVRYATLGSDARAWDRSAAVGLVVDDPLAALNAGLARTRLVTLALLLAAAAVLATAFSTVVTRPLAALTRTATGIAHGDLDRAFPAPPRGEIGELGTALERMRRTLRAQVELIRQQAEALQDGARRLVGAQDATRRRIAAELHDGVQQHLVVLRMQVAAARTQLEHDPGVLPATLDGLADQIDQALEELRATGSAVFPSILTDRGLPGALFSLAARVERTVAVTTVPDPFPRLDPVVETNAYFLVSEAVTNALKHAEADRIEVQVLLDAGELRVVVSDDGGGFPVGRVRADGGLTNLRDRVRALDGRLAVTSRPGAGSRVEAVLPAELAGLPGTPDTRSVGGPLEVEQHRSDPPVEVDLLGQPELAEDGVAVLLDRPLGEGQLPGDRGVAPA